MEKVIHNNKNIYNNVLQVVAFYINKSARMEGLIAPTIHNIVQRGLVSRDQITISEACLLYQTLLRRWPEEYHGDYTVYLNLVYKAY